MKDIKIFAKLMSSQELTFVKYLPTADAKYKYCLNNVAQHTKRYGGEAMCGWMFRCHEPKSYKQQYYLSAQHHAVWLNNDVLLDITPRPAEKALYPIMNEDEHLFLPDNNAVPIYIYDEINDEITFPPSPLPLQYYAIGYDLRLKKYVNELQKTEWKSYKNELVSLSKFGTPLQVKELIVKITINKYFTTLWSA